MANQKISALTALTGAGVDTAADVLAIVDTSAATTKKILIDELRIALLTFSGQAQTFLLADVVLNNTSNYFNVCNTGSIGASGQTWLLIGTAAITDTAQASTVEARIWDGSTVFANSAGTVATAGATEVITVCAIITPSSAATYHLSCKDQSSTNGAVRTTGNAGTANKATSIAAIRLL